MKVVLGVAVLVLGACAGVLLLATSWWSGGGSSAAPRGAVHGPDTPRFAGAVQLIAAARAGGSPCARARPFNPLQHIARDAVAYPAPDGLVCELPSGEPLYVVVYDTLPHRAEAVASGDTQFNLCGYTAQSSHATDAWNGLVAANWRVATPGSAESLAPLRAALGGTAEPESLSCQFRS